MKSRFPRIGWSSFSKHLPADLPARNKKVYMCQKIYIKEAGITHIYIYFTDIDGFYTSLHEMISYSDFWEIKFGMDISLRSQLHIVNWHVITLLLPPWKGFNIPNREGTLTWQERILSSQHLCQAYHINWLQLGLFCCVPAMSVGVQMRGPGGWLHALPGGKV